MTAEQLQNTNDLISAKREFNILNRRSDRLLFAKLLCSSSGYFSVSEMLTFVEEMRGLDLRQFEDREAFKSFFFCWVGGQEA
jgi:hypothetical protein